MRCQSNSSASHRYTSDTSESQRRGDAVFNSINSSLAVELAAGTPEVITYVVYFFK